jgi:signal transduction histidine kinase
MIGMVSHEIRTPLQTLVVAIDTLERMVPRDPARTAAFEAQLQRMRRVVERIAQCVDSMSDYALSANEISRQPAQAELVDVAAVMAELAAESSTRIAATRCPTTWTPPKPASSSTTCVPACLAPAGVAPTSPGRNCAIGRPSRCTSAPGSPHQTSGCFA